MSAGLALRLLGREPEGAHSSGVILRQAREHSAHLVRVHQADGR